nr:PQ-loop domain-containing transporter [Tardiphaga robiniae]
MSSAYPGLLHWLGGLAALLTSLSYVPQARKALPRGATWDLSLKTLGILTAGLSVWIVYGALKRRLGDCVGKWSRCDALNHSAVLQDPRHSGLIGSPTRSSLVVCNYPTATVLSPSWFAIMQQVSPLTFSY